MLLFQGRTFLGAQCSQRNAVHILVDQIVQPAPEPDGLALVPPRAFHVGAQTGDGRQLALHRPQDFPGGDLGLGAGPSR